MSWEKEYALHGPKAKNSQSRGVQYGKRRKSTFTNSVPGSGVRKRGTLKGRVVRLNPKAERTEI